MNPVARLHFASWFLLLAGSCLLGAAEPAPPTIVPPSMFQVPAGLEVTLWARSPMLRNPTNMDVDRQGRIWVAEGVNYRRHAGRDPAGDRIAVLEDTTGDGLADSSHTFVQEPMLMAPLGVAVVDNRIVVSNAPYLIVYTDVDRDLRFDPAIDQKDILLAGFEGQNHDHSLHSVTVGPDGWWYFNQGNGGAYFTDRSGRTFRLGSPYEPVRSGAIPFHGFRPLDYAGAPSDDGHVYTGGVAMRMRPDGTDVEVIGHGFRNSYEQTVTSFGDVFQNDNDDPPAARTSYLLEYGNAGFFSRDGTRHWLADRRPGQDTATAQWRQEDPGAMPAGDIYGAGAPTGIAYYENGALGPQWRGLLLSCEAARNLVFAYRPQRQGSTFTLERFSFLTTNPAQELAGVDSLRGQVSDELMTHFRPSDVAVGADGAIYVADWFDPRVGGHADHDDSASGAIYRIAPPGFKPEVPRFDLSTEAGQIAALRSPAVNVRQLGATRLRAAGSAALPAVMGLLEAENPYFAARAIALLPHLGETGVEQARALLEHENSSFRIAAYRALRRQQLHTWTEALHLVQAGDDAVRREVAVSLRDAPAVEALPVLMALARHYPPGDRTYLAAFGIAATNKEDALFERLGSVVAPDSSAYFDLAFTITPPAAVPYFVQIAQSSAYEEERRLQALTAIAFGATEAAAHGVYAIYHHTEGRVQETALWWMLNYMDQRWGHTDLAERIKAAGIYDPDNVTIVPSVLPAADPAQFISVASVQALAGDAGAGAAKIAACHLCHQVQGDGVAYGPALDGWVDRQGVEQTILALVNPSRDIAHGFEGSRVVLQDGTEVFGIIFSHGDPLVIKSMGGVTQMIPHDRIAQTHRHRDSLMLSADQLGLNAQDIADIVAYLQDT